ncbi:hypothetical protein GCAAIG_14150 [Candidatus Electronema halotolerans]
MNLAWFKDIAPHLSSPLVLVGFTYIRNAVTWTKRKFGGSKV